MSSTRAGLLDAVPVRGLLRKRTSIYDKGSKSRSQFYRQASMEMTDRENTVIEQRLPSTRPIDQRWDHSRGIIFSNARRSLGGNYAWSRNDGITFGELPSSARGYASRKLQFPSNTSPSQPPPVGNPGASRDLVDNPHRISSANIGKQHNLNLVEDNKRLRKANHDLRQETKEEIRSVHAKYAEEGRQLRESYAREIAKIRSESDDEARRLDNERASFRDQKQEELRKLGEREVEMHSKSLELETKTTELDKQAAELETTIDKRVEARTRVARKREEEAVADSDNYRREFQTKLKQATAQQEQEVREHKAGLTKATANRFVEELREMREAGTYRENVERADYASYHRIWDNIGDTTRTYLLEVRNEISRLNDQVDGWRRTKNEYKPDKIDPWFAIKYPELNSQIKEFLQSKIDGTKATAETLANLRNAVLDSQTNFLNEAHISRTLTRFHKFEAIGNKFMVTNMAQLTQEAEIRQEKERLAQEIFMARRTLARTTDRTTRVSLEQRIEDDRGKLAAVNRILSFIRDTRLCRALEALQRDTKDEKAIHLASLEPAQLQEQAWGDWVGYTTSNPNIGQDSDAGVKQARSDRHEFRAKYQEARTEIEDFTMFMRKQLILAAHTGEAKDDDAQLDAGIQAELNKAKANREKSLQAMLEGSRIRGVRVAHPSSFASSRSTNVLPSPATTQNSRATKRSKSEVESDLRALKQRLNESRDSSSKAEKEESAAKLRELKAELGALKIVVVKEKKAKLLKKSPPDHAGALRLDREIKNLNIQIAAGQGESEAAAHTAVQQNEASGTPDPTTSKTDAAGSKSKEPKIRRTSGRATMRRARKVSSRDAPKSPSQTKQDESSSKPVSNASNKQQASPPFTFTNFRPTGAKQASWNHQMSSNRALHAESSLRNYAAPASHAADHLSRDTFEAVPLSQALRQNSTRDTRKQSSRLAPSNIDRHFNMLSLEDDLNEVEIDHESDQASSQGSVESAASASSEHSEYDTKDMQLSSQESAIAPSDHLRLTESSSKPIMEAERDVELTYNMSDTDYRNAFIASKNTTVAYWSYKLYKNANGKIPTVLYCTNFDKAEEKAQLFLNESVIGFDMEWEPQSNLTSSSPKRSLSLIQIASEDKILLIHLALFKGETSDELMPPSLRAILTSRSIAKTGVNVSGDANRMHKVLGAEMKGLFELSHLYRVVQFSENRPSEINKKLIGLQEQVHTILGLPLKKDAVRTSAWSTLLKVEQSEYAASDAYAGLRLYHALEAKRKKMDPTPPRPAFHEEGQPLVDGHGQSYSAKIWAPKRKREINNDLDKAVELDDDEGDEYFDAADGLDVEPPMSSESTSSQPTNGSQGSYHSMPSFAGSQEATDAEHESSKLDTIESAAPAPPRPVKQSRANPPASEKVTLATTWAQETRLTLPCTSNLKGRTAPLRAYHMWHEQLLDSSEIANLLGISVATVSDYLLTVLKDGNLAWPSEETRVKAVVELMPVSARWRHRSVIERIGQDMGS